MARKKPKLPGMHQRARRHVQDDDEAARSRCSTRTSGKTRPPRARGVIALKEENCTVCMLCARAVPRLVHLHRGPQGEAPAAP